MAGETVLGNMVIHITAEAEAFNKAVAATEKKVDSAGKEIQKSGFKITELNSALEIGAKAFNAVKEVIEQSVGSWVDYNKQVRESTQLTGLSAQETSRIIQVADDWGIELESVRGALEMMNKRGIQPSIENLAAIADEYVNTKDKTAFMEEATKKYGRTFSELVPMLVNGGDAFRANAAGIANNMIATEDSMATTRDYEVALDDFNDAWEGIRNTLAMGVIPILTKAIEIINGATASSLTYYDASSAYYDLVKMGIVSDKENWQVQMDIGKVLFDNDKQLQIYLAVIKKYQGLIDYSNQAEREELIRRGLLVPTTEDLAGATDGLAGSVAKYDLEAMKAQQSADELTRAYDDMNLGINGRLGPEMENFTKKQGDLETQMADVKAEIDKAISEGYSPLSEKVVGLQGDYDNLKGQYTENETEHDRASKEIMFDIMEQRLSLDGLSKDELAVLDSFRVAWGLSDQATVDYMGGVDDASTWLAKHPGDVATATSIINGQETSWGAAKKEALLARDAVGDYMQNMNALDGKTVDTYINNHITNWVSDQRESNRDNGRQSGVENFIVPPGYANDSYLMWLSSGEKVDVTPANRINNSSGGKGNGDTINIYNPLAYKMWKESRDRETRKRLEAIL